MGLLVPPRWLLVATVALGSAGVASACSAAPPGDPETDVTGAKPDSGTSLKIPNPDGGSKKGCGTGGSSSTEIPGANGCGTGGSGGSGNAGGSGAGGGNRGEKATLVPAGATPKSQG